MSLKNWLQFWYIAIMWGATFLWLKIGIREIPPITLNAYRLTISSLGLLLFLWLTKTPFPFLKHWKTFLILGLFNVALPFAAITMSEQHITTAMASMLNAATPLFTMTLAAFFLADEGWTWRKVIGIGLGVAGVYILVFNKLSETSQAFQYGQLLVLGACLAYGIGAVYSRKHAPDLKPPALAAGQAIMAAVSLWVAALITESPIRFPTQGLTWISIFWLGILATAIGTTIFFYLLKDIGAGRTMMSHFTFPVIGVILGMVFLNETVDWHFVLGGALILLGILVVNRSIRLPEPAKENL
ncbi:MAG TPA: EamA family transporter [Bellilinea sp.]|nr:EamA family transporter [Bellilinea sp.]